MIRRRAARWVNQEYGITSVNAILNNPEWSLLSKRRQCSRLTLFFKFLHQDPASHLLSSRIPQHYHGALNIDSLHEAHSPSTLHPTIHIYNIFPKEFLPIIQLAIPDNILIENDTLDHFMLSLKSYTKKLHNIQSWSHTLQLDLLLLNCCIILHVQLSS